MSSASFDPWWEKTYAQGQQQNKYPWSDVVSFVFRNAPKDVPPKAIAILEVGCGTGPNVIFAAQEGFAAHGIDGSKTAVALARKRLADLGLTADLRLGDFTDLPYQDGSFDLVIDRAALTHTDPRALVVALREIRRVLKRGGKFLFTPFGDSHTSFSSGAYLPSGARGKITAGAMKGVGQVTFLSRKDIADLLRDGWAVLSCARRETVDMTKGPGDILTEWIVIAQKVE